MASAYHSPGQLLDDALRLVFELVRRQITAFNEVGFLPVHTDAYSGTFVSPSDLRTLLDGGRPPSPEGIEQLAAIDRGIAALAREMEARLAASRAAGRPLIFDTVRRALGLSPTEARALLVVVACEINQRVRHMMRYLVNDAVRLHPDVGFVEQLVYSAPELR